MALALDPTGKIYVTGLTFSSDFPTTAECPQAKSKGRLTSMSGQASSRKSIRRSAARVRLSILLTSAELMGSPGLSTDFGNAVAVDANGNAYVTGITSLHRTRDRCSAVELPVMNAFQATLTSYDGNAFLTRIDTTSPETLLWFTPRIWVVRVQMRRLPFADAGFGVAVDSSTMPTSWALLPPRTFRRPRTDSRQRLRQAMHGTAFVARIDTTKSGNASLVYSTYLGGEVSDFGMGIALGPNNVAYATGTTQSLLFPTTTGAFQSTGNATSRIAFVSLVDTGKTGAASLPYSTYLGGTGVATGSAVRADGTGNAYVVGTTDSADFPVTPGPWSRYTPARRQRVL